MRKINWGIIGLGNIANKFGDAFYSINNSQLKAISSKNKSKIKNFKKKYNIENQFCFENYEDLINCPDIDIIYIALPNNLHHEWIDQCIKLKKNVLVEKPALMTVNQVLDIKNKLSLNKVYFTEAFMYKFSPHMNVIIDQILKGSIGELTHMISDFSIKAYKISKIFGFTYRKPNLMDRKYNKELGGGSIFDLGCYPLSLSTQIANIKKKFTTEDIKISNVKKNICESGVEISASCKIQFDNDFFSNISCSFENNSDQKTIIYGTLGNISFENTWKPNSNFKIKIESEKEKKIIKCPVNENIYSYQIKEISDQLIGLKQNPEKPAINIEEILLNTLIMTNWIDYKV